MPPLDWSKIRTLPLSERRNKVSIAGFCPRPETRISAAPAAAHAAPAAAASLRDLSPLDLMPDILAGRQWREFVECVREALAARRPVVLMLGGHVIKVGLAPLIVSLMERGAVSHLAMNGAAAIHDYEIALIGETSEDVAVYLEDGRFGLWEETGGGMNAIVNAAAARPDGPGFGEALGRAINEGAYPHRAFSILAAAHRLGIPATVHAAIGAEIIHEHPTCSGAAIGELSYRDFKRFAETLAGLEGGVAMNWGSAVIMPEVFLKALTVARNLGANAHGFTSATFDMIRQYRPLANVVDRPTGAAAGRPQGRGFQFLGHHEILFPLLYASLARAGALDAAPQDESKEARSS